VKIYQHYTKGQIQEAQALQHSVAKAEWWLNKTGINGTKWVVAKLLGYEESKCHTRRPYPLFADKNMQERMVVALQPIQTQERSLKV
jgi:dihydrodipicolinate synthase/N-acetylneuraminate lyase